MITSRSMLAAGNQFVNSDKVLLWENTRKEIREALESGRLKAAIVPTGATEQHNEHLALATDFAMATLIAQQAALKLYPQVIVSVPCPVGYSPYHMARKGNLTLRKETLKAYVFDLVESLSANGIGTILIVNGHSGNDGPLRESLPEWRERLGGINLDATSYWTGISAEDMKRHVVSGAGVGHASEFETSVIMAAFPERVRSFTMEEYDRAGLDYDSNLSPKALAIMERHYGKGGWPRRGYSENDADRKRQEDALLAKEEKGQALIGLATQYVSGKMQEMIDASEKGKP